MLGYLTFQPPVRKAMNSLEFIGSERFRHFLKVMGKQQDKVANLGLFILSFLSFSSRLWKG